MSTGKTVLILLNWRLETRCKPKVTYCFRVQTQIFGQNPRTDSEFQICTNVVTGHRAVSNLDKQHTITTASVGLGVSNLCWHKYLWSSRQSPSPSCMLLSAVAAIMPAGLPVAPGVSWGRQHLTLLERDFITAAVFCLHSKMLSQLLIITANLLSVITEKLSSQK